LNRNVSLAIGAAALVLIAAGTWWWWWHRPAHAALTVAPPAAATATPAVDEPAVKYPVDAPVTPPAPSPIDLSAALNDLLGAKTVLALFRNDDLAHRITATIDNLGQSYAPTALWPVNPAGGRFTTERVNDADVIGAGNAARYTPYVSLFESIDLTLTMKSYVQFYPQLQQAYEKLGYPKRYFNDRLVEVIDQLLATPEPGDSPRVHLPPIDPSVQPARPWVLYEYDDPALQSLSAGQKVLLRMGTANERRVKAKLTELRRLVTAVHR
jgi:hypothetical protein